MTDLPAGAIPDEWSAYLPILMGTIRTLLGVLGGAGFSWAVGVNDSQIQMVISAAMIVAAGLWSAYQKIKASRALAHAAAAPAGLPAPKLPM